MTESQTESNPTASEAPAATGGAAGAADASATPLPVEVSPKEAEAAEALKAEANTLFAHKSYEAAIDKYSQAITFNPNVAVYYANRAFAQLKLEYYGAAIADAKRAIAVDPNYVKAYYRRASAYMALGRLKLAINDLKTVVKFAPQDADAKAKLAQCTKEHNAAMFAKAIAFDSPDRDVAVRIGDLSNIPVDPSYDGPVLNPVPLHTANQDVAVGDLAALHGITAEWAKSLLDYMAKQKILHRRYALQLLLAVLELLKKEPAVVDVTIPDDAKMIVCGDIHGQFYDLLHIFEKNGHPSPKVLYLFNGDFVDRGSFSIECALALLTYKLLYPRYFFISRGNHETDDMNKVYGFKGECLSKYTPLTYELFTQIFNAIPLGNIIQEKILVLHGGLFSRDGVKLDELRAINRFSQPGSAGNSLMQEMLWSDPRPAPGRGPSRRGAGIEFGPDITKAFLEENNLDYLIRSHELKAQGYEEAHDGKCITIFSAPNYCDSEGNQGAWIVLKPDRSMTFEKFSAQPHPTNVRAMQYANQGGWA